MSLSSGTRLGHYDVGALIGEGGMGQVWQATDTQLNRQVALKILPDAFAADPDRLARFQREAQVLASLNHPGIAQIYGIEEAEGTRALVLELVEGPTLADRIAAGPIPIDEAQPIAQQIAEALEAAHEAGVIHRDLKPANIKVRDDGTVKVLDFGLAKALETTREGDPSQSPTLTAAATQMGVIMGTAAYMSPEQAKGKVADKRADIWSFGVVLYEMLTGRRLFEAADVSEVLASVLLKDLDLSGLGQQMPPSLRTLLARCLVKDPRDRLRDIGEARLALRDLDAADARGGSSPAASSEAGRAPAWRAAIPYASAALLLGGVLGGAAVWSGSGDGPSNRELTKRFTVAMPDHLRVSGTSKVLALSPDGSTLVVNTTTVGGAPQLYARSIDQLLLTPIRGTEGATGPFFSPDGEWVGFAVDGELKKTSLRGGAPQTICALPGGYRLAAWGKNDRVVIASTTGLWDVPASGGDPELLTPLDTDSGEIAHLYPQVLPGGNAVVFTSLGAGGRGVGGNAAVELFDFDTSERRVLIDDASEPHFVTAGGGHLVFGRGDSVWAVRFDVAALDVTGTPFLVHEGVVDQGAAGGTQLVASRGGMLVYLDGTRFETSRALVWVDRQGREEPIGAPLRRYIYPRLSPDGQTIAAVAFDAATTGDIWTWSLTRRTQSRLTSSPGTDSYPIWTPDSGAIVYSSGVPGDVSLYRRAADGTGEPERLTESGTTDLATAIAPDGTSLVFGQETATGGQEQDLFLLPLEPAGEVPRPILATEFVERNADISPDGRWLAYESNASGRFEVHVRPFPDVQGGLQQISTDGGVQPRWSRDGDELFYLAPDGYLMAVGVGSGAALTAATPARLFRGDYYVGRGPRPGRTYDVAPDGDRFLMITETSEGLGEIVVLLDWLDRPVDD